MLTLFLQCLYYHRSASAKFAATPFLHPLQLLLWGWGHPARSSPLADSPTLRTLSKMVKKLRQSWLWSPDTFWMAPSFSSHEAVWSFTWLTSWGLQILVKSGMNHFSQHIVGLSEFHHTLLTIILYFGGNISDRNRLGEISLIRRRRFSYFAFW